MKKLPDNWAAQSRLRAIERTAWWRGWLGRNDLIEQFGLSPAQATNDLRRYQELNPQALAYDLSDKRYRAVRKMRCVLHEPRLSEGLAAFLGGSGMAVVKPPVEGEHLAEVGLPQRGCDARVARHVVLAALGEQALSIRYASARSGEVRQRRIAPHAFGWEGSRWHARAFDFDSGEYRDFVLGRMEQADWPTEEAGALPVDEAWETIETLRLQLNSALSEGTRRALQMDYDLGEDNVLSLSVRRAMRGYQLKLLGLDIDGQAARQDFEFVSCGNAAGRARRRPGGSSES